MRLEYPAGARMLVDYSGDKVPVLDPGTGEVSQAEVFVAVLGCSGMLFAEASASQDLPNWLMAHVHAYEAYGGVAEATTPDNLKSGVTRACYYDPEVNASYAELARHYGTVILPTRAVHPRDKAAVEAGVLQVERWVLAPLRNRTFYSLAELNRAIRDKVAELNAKAFRGEPTSRAELFEELERPALKPLPAKRYELSEWKKVTVNIDYHVEFDRRYYSVPYTLVRQKLEVRATKTIVEVYKGGRRVASHAREYGRRRYITDPAHMPPSHRAHLEWTPSRLVTWAKTVSPHAAALAQKLLESKPHPEHSYRACLGLMSLAKRYGNERLGAACARALLSGAVSYTSVKSILAEGLDRVPLPARRRPPRRRPSTRTCAVLVITPKKRRHRCWRTRRSPSWRRSGWRPWPPACPTSSAPRGPTTSSASPTGSACWSTKRPTPATAGAWPPGSKRPNCATRPASRTSTGERPGAWTARSSWAWPRARG